MSLSRANALHPQCSISPSLQGGQYLRTALPMMLSSGRKLVRHTTNQHAIRTLALCHLHKEVVTLWTALSSTKVERLV
jgi:hypothetical protein